MLPILSGLGLGARALGGVASRISKSIGVDDSNRASTQSGMSVKGQSKTVVDVINNSNQILGDILSTLQQSLALQQSAVKPSRDELLEESQSAFKIKSKGIGSRIASSAKKVGGSIAKVAGIGATALAGAAGIQGFMNAEDIFGEDFEGTMSQKIASAIGNIIEKASFGLVKNKDIAKNIDSFFTAVRNGFKKGIEFLERTFEFEFFSEDKDKGFFAVMGNKISNAYNAFINSDAVKSISKLFSGIFEADTKKIKEGATELQNQIVGVFEKMFDIIFGAVGKITIPLDAPFFAGRSLGNLMGGKATSDMDVLEEADTSLKESKGFLQNLANTINENVVRHMAPDAAMKYLRSEAKKNIEEDRERILKGLPPKYLNKDIPNENINIVPNDKSSLLEVEQQNMEIAASQVNASGSSGGGNVNKTDITKIDNNSQIMAGKFKPTDREQSFNTYIATYA